MKTQQISILLAIILVISVPLKAQYVVTSQANRPRPGDNLVMQEIEYPDPGKSGKNIVWNFGKLMPVEKKKGTITKPLNQMQPGEDITKYLQMPSSYSGKNYTGKYFSYVRYELHPDPHDDPSGWLKLP